MRGSRTVLVFLSLFSASCGSDSGAVEDASPTPDTVLDAATAPDSAQDTSATLELPGEVTGEDTVASTQDSVTDEGLAPSSPCAFPLVYLQTGKDTNCDGGNTHAWPIGMAATSCHGWKAVDTSGNEHNNSANAIGCNADGSFTFTQFAGNLDCSGTGVVKTFVADQCEQDIPPVLYTKAVNLTCCTDPEHPDCQVGIPTVSIPGGTVYLNGTLCE
jgi:hypothetical protein